MCANLFTPSRQPEVTIYYNLIPGQRQTFHQPGFADEVEIVKVQIHGQDISPETDFALVVFWGEVWTKEILAQKKEAA